MNKKINKNILIVHGRLSSGVVNYGGWRKQLIWLGNGLANRGYDVTFCTVYDTNRAEQICDEAKSIELGLTYHNSFLLRNLTLFLLFPFKIWHVLRNKKYNVVISFGDTSFFILLLFRIAFKYRFIVSERADPNYNVSVWDRLKRYLYRKVDSVVFQTAGAQAYFNDNIISKSIIIPNPILIPNFRWNENTFYKIASVGRIDFWQKRQDVLLDAFEIVHNQYPNSVLHIYGSGKDMDKLKKLISEKKLEPNVVLFGKVVDVSERLSNDTVFVLTSDFEGIPNALLEAMALGMPVVSTKCSPGGAEFVIEHGVNGLLADCGDSEGIAKSISLILEDSEYAKLLASNARKSMGNFSEDKILTLWEKAI